MSNPTTPFSWQMPQSTDLVTDLPADFEVFGQAVATSMADLLGGTTGQVLSKNSNTDMDFVWVAGSTPGLTKITSNTFSAVSSVSLPNSTFTSTYTNYKVIFIISTSSASPAITGRYRASGTDNTASTYYNAVNVNRVDGSAATQNNVNAGTAYNLGYVSTNTVGLYGITLDFLSPQAAAKKQITGGGFGWNATVSDAFASYQIGGFFNNTTQFDAFSLIASTGTITGSYAVYGYQS